MIRKTVAALAAATLTAASLVATTTGTASATHAGEFNSTSSETLASGRTYQLRTDRNRHDAVPLVIALHGYSSSASALSTATGLSAYADLHDFALAYGHTSGNAAWNSGEGLDTTPQDDVTYLRQVVADAALKTPVDLSRVYVWGFSNGSMMAQRALCEAGDLFAAGAGVAGPLAAQVAATPCNADFNFYAMHGTADTTVPLFGGAGINGINFAPNWNGDLRKGRGTGVVLLNPRVGMAHEWPSYANGEFKNFSFGFTN